MSARLPAFTHDNSPTTLNAELAELTECRKCNPRIQLVPFTLSERLTQCARICINRYVVTNEYLNTLTHTIIGAAIAVHHELGPGMLESPYEACLAYELMDRGYFVERQKPLPLVYRGQTIDCGFRIDLLIERVVVVEVKSIERFDRVHAAQLSYLRLSGCRVGLLINFNVKWLVEDGIKRVVNGFSD